MPIYDVMVIRTTWDTIKLTINAQSDIEAHRQAEAEVTDGMHRSNQREVRLSVVACCQKLSKGATSPGKDGDVCASC